MKYKKVGKLSIDIAEKCNLKQHKNKPILVFDDRIEHVINRHLTEFETVENIMNVYNNLSNIINKPDYFFYNKEKNGLEYYKKLKNNFCVVVRINYGNVLKVKSWYPVNKNKINNRKRQNIENKTYIKNTKIKVL